MTLNSFLVLISFIVAVFLPLFLRKINKKIKIKIHPAILLFVVLPLAYFIFSYDAFTTENILDWIILYNYSVTFLLLSVIIPLALFHRLRNAKKIQHTCDYKISVIIPIFNEEKTISRTINSILSSKYTKKEIIAIDNGSTDNTKSILKSFGKKIKICYEPKKGKANAINRGLLVASGEIIVIIDADTVIEKHAFSNIIKPFSDPKIGAVTGNVKILNAKNIHTKLQILEYALASQLGKAALASQQTVNIVSGAFGAFRRSVIMSRTSPFTEDTLTEDLDATITILKKGYRTTIQYDAIAFTEVPFTFKDIIKQRTRWCRGLIQGYAKHPDLLKNPPFDHIPNLIYFMSFNFSLIVPIVTIINTFSFISSILFGSLELAFVVFMLNFVLVTSLFSLSLFLDKQKIDHVHLFPLAFFYFTIHNFIFLKALLEHIFTVKAEWNHLERDGSTTQL